MNCINLLGMFGDKYRVTFERDSAEGPRDRDPWLHQIPCQGRGVIIYLYGGTTLAVDVDRRPSIAARLRALDGVKLHQDGDTEKTFLFDMSLFDQVAVIVKPRRKRKAT